MWEALGKRLSLSPDGKLNAARGGGGAMTRMAMLVSQRAVSAGEDGRGACGRARACSRAPKLCYSAGRDVLK